MVGPPVPLYRVLETCYPWHQTSSDSRQGAIVAWEDGLVTFESTLGRAHVECDAECDRAEVVRQDYQARIHAFTADCRHSFNFDRILEVHQILLSLQATDLERREEMLVEEQAQSLHFFDGRDLSTELEELRERVAGVDSECATEAMALSRSVMGIFDVLVDLGTFPIRDIPEHPKLAQDVLMVVGLLLECLWQEHASDIGSWD
jgi:hypothetical protein